MVPPSNDQLNSSALELLGGGNASGGNSSGGGGEPPSPLPPRRPMSNLNIGVASCAIVVILFTFRVISACCRRSNARRANGGSARTSARGSRATGAARPAATLREPMLSNALAKPEGLEGEPNPDGTEAELAEPPPPSYKEAAD